MSHDTQKADQIAFHFYTKLFYVVNDARTTSDPRAPLKVDKWFNLETPEYSDLFTREAREPYRFVSTSSDTLSLEVQVLLTIPELTNNQVLVHLAPDSSRVRVEPTPRHILLEQWVLSFKPRGIYEEQDSEQIALPTIYKHGIPLFRSLYSLLRILPAWKVCKRLRPRGITNINPAAGLTVQVRVRTDSTNDSILGFSSSPSPSHSPLPTSSHTFPSVPHPMGTFTLSTTYLSTPNFRLDELESLLSSRFMSLDVGPEFTPTLIRNQQRDSLLSTGSASGSSPGSLPIRTSLPRSPPRDILRPSHHHHHHRSRSRADNADSIAERFVLPSRATSMSDGASGILQRNPPVSLPIARTTSTTSTRTQVPSGIAARLRRESLGSHTGASASDSYLPSSGAGPSALSSFPPSMAPQVFPTTISTSIPSSSSVPGSGSSLPSTSSPLSMRRPGLNSVHLFKSSTVADASGSNPVSTGLGLNLGLGGTASPSSSLRQTTGGRISPLSSMGLPALPTLSSVPSRSGMSSVTGVPTSPIGLGPGQGTTGGNIGGGGGQSGISSSGVGYTRPSPTFTPSSLGDRRSVVSAEGAISSGSVSSTTGIVGPSHGGGGGAGMGEGSLPPRKRYSSSFGHRYSSTAVAGGSVPGGAGVSLGSEGSPRSHYSQMSTGGGGVGSAGQGSIRSIRSGGSGGAGAGGAGITSTSASPGAAGAAGAERREKEGGGASFLNTNTDDDDISEFVQDIDMRKPLSGRSKIFASAHARRASDGQEVVTGSRPRQRSGLAGASVGVGGDELDDDEGEEAGENSEEQQRQRLSSGEISSDRDKTIRAREESKERGELPRFTHLGAQTRSPTTAEEEEAGIYAVPPRAGGSRTGQLSSQGGSGPRQSPSSPPMGSQAMLTSEAEVEAKLKRMNDTFLASLEGLGGGTSNRSRSGGSGSGSGSAGGGGRGSPSRVERVRTTSLRSGREGESNGSSPISPSRLRLLGGAEGSVGGTQGSVRDHRGGEYRDSWGGSLGSPASIGSYGGGRGRGSGRGSPVPSPLYAQFSGRSRHGSTSTTVSEFISQSGQGSGQGSEEVIGRLELGGGSGMGSS